MGKRVLQIVILTILCACCAIGFAACEDNGSGHYTPDTPHVHNFIDTVIAPTCTTGGYTLHECSCGEKYTDTYTNALEHDYEWMTTKEPTETEDGIKTGVCKLCGESITKIIPLANHEHNYIITVIEPTCFVGGYILHKCACGAEYVSDEISATGHEFTHYVSDGNATYESDGTKTAYCNNGCGTTDTVPDIGSKLVYSGITFNTLTASGTNVNGKVPNSQNTFSFLTEINVSGGATYSVSYDINGNNTIPNKTVNLNVGDNIFYVLEKVNGEASNLFTLTIRRRPIYTVSFNSNGGTSVASQQIEEDSFATEPTIERTGYTFTGWNYNFDKPITKATTITASWVANTNTKYKVEYYLQNLEDNNYTLHETENLTGETDKQATAEIKTFNHFTHTTISNSIESANIDCDETTTLKVYYTRDKYTIKLVAGDNVTLNRTYSGDFKYGYQIKEITATVNNYLGYEWKGWHNGDDVLTYDKMISAFTVKENLSYTADFAVKEEMQNFDFTSNAIDCIIWSVKDKNITDIIIPDYVTSLGSRAFSVCSSLTSVTIGNSVTSIGNLAFAGCSGLTSVTIPDSVTSIGDNAFSGCGSLMDITIPNSVTSIGANIFLNCHVLTSLYYTGTASEWASKIDGLENIMGRIRTLYINNAPVQNVVLENITKIKPYAFRGCSSLTSVTIGNSVTSIGNSAFYYCSGLTSITIPDSVTSIEDNAFSSCSGLTSIIVDDNNPNYKSIDGDLYGKDGKTLITYAAGKMSTNFTILSGVTSIGRYAFCDCYKLTSITIPDSVTSIGNYAFYHCSNLTSITIPDSVTSIGYYAFSECYDLTSVTIGKRVTSIGGGAFEYCSSLTSVTFVHPYNWYVCLGGSPVSAVSSVELLNQSCAARLLKSDYLRYEWKR